MRPYLAALTSCAGQRKSVQIPGPQHPLLSSLSISPVPASPSLPDLTPIFCYAFLRIAQFAATGGTPRKALS